MNMIHSDAYSLGPVLMTVGPWKPIYLQTYNNRIVDLDVRSDISESLDVKLTADITFSTNAPGFASFILRAPDGSIEASANKISTDTGHCKLSFNWAPGKLNLWYPVGYGAQPLYTAEVELADEARIFSSYFQLRCSASTERSSSRPEIIEDCLPSRARCSGSID